MENMQNKKPPAILVVVVFLIGIVVKYGGWSLGVTIPIFIVGVLLAIIAEKLYKNE